MLRAFLRSFTVQGSWNYRTMLGGGFAFALMPALKRIHGDGTDAFSEAVRRHAELFNAHPYLAGMAMGAVLRLEADGEPADLVRRFKVAVRGSLGGLGDALVWAGWLPANLLLALVGWLTGTPWWVVIPGFLVVYNAGHLVLRAWAFRAGLAEGKKLGKRIQASGLKRRTETLGKVCVVLVGVVAGTLFLHGPGLALPVWPWAALAIAGFATGVFLGQEGRRPAAYGFTGLLIMLFLVGTIL